MATIEQGLMGFSGELTKIEKLQAIVNAGLNISNNLCTQNNILLEQSANKMKDIEKAAESAASQMKEVVVAAENAANRISNIGTAAKSSTEPITKMEKATNLFKMGLNEAKNLAISLAKEMIRIQEAMDQMDVELPFLRSVENMTGSSEIAQAALSHLKNTVKGTGYSLDTATQSALAFAKRGMNMGGAVEQVRIWGDAVAYYGQGTDEQLRSVLSTLDKMSRGTKIDTSHLEALSDVAGIEAVEMYGEAVGRTRQEVERDLASGAISAVEFLNTLTRILSEGPAAGAAQDMEQTWKTTFDNLKNSIADGWANALKEVDQVLANEGLPSVKDMLETLGEIINNVITKVGKVISWVVMILTPFIWMGTILYDNWSIIEPMLWGIIAAFTAYQLILNRAAIQSFIATASTQAYVAAVILCTAAQQGLNAAMAANPVGFIIGAIIILISLFYAAVAAINHFMGTSISATGLIMGAFAVLSAFFHNTFYVPLWNIFAEIGNFIGNVFNDPIAAIQVLFYDLVIDVLGYMESLAGGIEALINKIPGIEVDITSGLSNLKKDMEKVQNDIKDKSGWIEYFQKQEYKNIAKEGASGYKVGDELENKLKKKLSVLEDPNGFQAPDEQMLAATQNTANNTGSMANSMEISGEDLKYMRDIADREAINRFTTAELSVNMQTSATVNGSLDIDGIISQLEEKTHEMLVVAAEGV